MPDHRRRPREQVHQIPVCHDGSSQQRIHQQVPVDLLQATELLEDRPADRQAGTVGYRKAIDYRLQREVAEEIVIHRSREEGGGNVPGSPVGGEACDQTDVRIVQRFDEARDVARLGQRDIAVDEDEPLAPRAGYSGDQVVDLSQPLAAWTRYYDSRMACVGGGDDPANQSDRGVILVFHTEQNLQGRRRGLGDQRGEIDVRLLVHAAHRHDDRDEDRGIRRSVVTRATERHRRRQREERDDDHGHRDEEREERVRP